MTLDKGAEMIANFAEQSIAACLAMEEVKRKLRENLSRAGIKFFEIHDEFVIDLMEESNDS